MPKRNAPGKGRPWVARVTYRYAHMYLGQYDTWQEAMDAENVFRKRRGMRPYNPRQARRTYVRIHHSERDML